MEGGYSEFAKFTVPSLKCFLNARNHNVSGSKQRHVARAIGCPKNIISTKSRFSGHPKHDAVKTLFIISTKSRFSGQPKHDAVKTLFFPSDSPSPSPCNS